MAHLQQKEETTGSTYAEENKNGNAPPIAHQQDRGETYPCNGQRAMDRPPLGDEHTHRQQWSHRTIKDSHEEVRLPSDFIHHMEYPAAPDEVMVIDPLKVGVGEHYEDGAQVMSNDTYWEGLAPILDTTKWPFPHLALDHKTADIYEAVRASGCHNHEGQRITLPTNLRISAWQEMGTGHPQDEMVLQGIQYGFPIQYCGPPQYTAAIVPNHTSATSHLSHIKQYIKEELDYGALEGPFKAPPFTPWFVTSPLMTREKNDSSDRRIIVDLSFPEGGVNKYIIPHVFNGQEATHNLPTVETAVRTIAATCPGQITMAVIDLSRAYRQFAVSPLDWPLLGIAVDGDVYFDRRLPFGARMSSYTMQMAADFIVRALSKKNIRAHMYLDDLVIISPTPQIAVREYNQTLQLIRELGLEVATKKLQPPGPTARWLGIDFDLDNNLLAIPLAKMEEIQRCMAAAAKKEVITKKQLQRIIGMANHLGKVVRAARIFIGRILTALRAAQNDHIQITRHVKADLRWFARFLASANGRAIIPTHIVVARIWADACMDGAGASDGSGFYTHRFPTRVKETHHIAQLEALNCVAAARAFVGPQHAGGTIEIHCDNKPSVDAFKSGRARDPVLAACTRALWFRAAQTDTSFTFTHVPGEAMALPDALSRVHVDKEHRDLAKTLIARLRLKPTRVTPLTFSYSAFM